MGDETYCCTPSSFQRWEAIPHLPHMGHQVDEVVLSPAAGGSPADLPPAAFSVPGSRVWDSVERNF